MKIKLSHPDARIPERATDGSAGYDLYSTRDVCIWPGDKQMIDTGVCIEIPRYVFGLVCSRSGLGAKYGITLVNGVGVIDSDYRGSIKMPLINLGKKQHWIRKGDRIGQIVFLPCFAAEKFEVVQELAETDRGAGGFGSTGK
jgi:dUTP pyrophosphatase